MTQSRQPCRHSIELTDRLRWYAHQMARSDAADCGLLVIRPVEQPGGKPAPDWAMNGLARCVRSHIRRSDAIETDGGRALVIILPGATMSGAHAVFVRMRDLLSAAHPGADGSIIVAAGYASAPRAALYMDQMGALFERAWQPRALLSVNLIGRKPELEPSSFRTSSGDAVLGEADDDLAAGMATLKLLRPHRSVMSESLSLRDYALLVGVPCVTMPERLPMNCRGAIAPALARELGAVAIGRSGNTLTVAMRDPRDLAAIMRLRSATGLSIFPVLAEGEELSRALDVLSGV